MYLNNALGDDFYSCEVKNFIFRHKVKLNWKCNQLGIEALQVTLWEIQSLSVKSF